jgi:hypothetical protein
MDTLSEARVGRQDVDNSAASDSGNTRVLSVLCEHEAEAAWPRDLRLQIDMLWLAGCMESGEGQDGFGGGVAV